jgi:[acyl-carrier-protein] S-malonyltransferase
MRVAFVFPGQGSQSVGMLAALAAASGVVRAPLPRPQAVLGYDLWKLAQEGPAEELNRTECTQPAMLAAGVATWRFWREAGGRMPDVVCGHSLGEFSALVCAGTLAFPAAVDLVAFRARAMQEAVPLGSGAMAAILGLDDAAVLAACREAAGAGIVEAVNFNGPNQVVIAGDRAAVERAMQAATARGAKRAVLLPVSVPRTAASWSRPRGASAKSSPASSCALPPFPISAPSMPPCIRTGGYSRAPRRPARAPRALGRCRAGGARKRGAGAHRMRAGQSADRLNRRIERRANLRLPCARRSRRRQSRARRDHRSAHA